MPSGCPTVLQYARRPTELSRAAARHWGLARCMPRCFRARRTKRLDEARQAPTDTRRHALLRMAAKRPRKWGGGRGSARSNDTRGRCHSVGRARRLAVPLDAPPLLGHWRSNASRHLVRVGEAFGVLGRLGSPRLQFLIMLICHLSHSRVHYYLSYLRESVPRVAKLEKRFLSPLDFKIVNMCLKDVVCVMRRPVPAALLAIPERIFRTGDFIEVGCHSLALLATLHRFRDLTRLDRAVGQSSL